MVLLLYPLYLLCADVKERAWRRVEPPSLGGHAGGLVRPGASGARPAQKPLASKPPKLGGALRPQGQKTAQGVIPFERVDLVGPQGGYPWLGPT